MALAPLGFTVDTGPVAKAVADLDKLTSATVKAEAGTKGITAPTTAAAAATRQLGAASAAAATQMTIATNAVKANNAALQISNQSAGAAQMQMRNLAFQFQDIGTMLVAGQSPFMLLAQQLPQVTMYGGQLTGVMGALKSTIAGLFSPLGLLTTGFVLAGSAAISYFTSATDESDAAAEALAEQADLIQRVADKWGDAIPALREYAKAIEDAKDAAELQQAAQLTQNSYLDELRELLPQVNAELSRFAATASGGGWGSALEQDAASLADAYDEVYRALQEAARATGEGEDATDALAAANRALSSILNSDAIPSVGGMRDALDLLTDAYGRATEAARLLNNQQATAAAREANLGRFDKAGQRLSQDGADPLSDMEFNSRSGWDEVFDFPREKTPRKPRKSEAERHQEMMEARLEALQQSLMTEEELEQTSYANRLIQIQEFEEAKMLSKASADELMELAHEQHHERMAEVARKAAEKEAAYRDQVGYAYARTLGSLADLVSSFGDKHLAAAKALAIGEAVVNTAVGITAALRIPGPLGWAQAAAVAASGAAQIATIMAAQKGGGAKAGVGGGGASAAPAAPQAPAEQQTLNLTLRGLNPSQLYTGEQVRELAEALVEYQRDGGRLVLVEN